MVEGGVVVLGAGVEDGGVTTGGGGVTGAGAVDGEADGTRSVGDSPTRSVDERLQAVSMPRPSAMTQRPVAILFMCEPPPPGVRGVIRDPARWGCNADARGRRLDRVDDNYYQCGGLPLRKPKGDAQ